MTLKTTFLQLLISLLKKINDHLQTSYGQDFVSTMVEEESFE